MAKYSVTPELSETLRSVRMQNHISAKAVAEHIGKSQSYMSKLERGDIKSIQDNELTEIFRFIFGNERDLQVFLDSALGRILETLELRYSDDEIKEQVWFDNYDTVLRIIPIPEELVDHLNLRIESLGVSIDELCSRINANEGISPNVINTDRYPFNEWQPFVENHKITFRFIKMRVTAQAISDILEKRVRSANYVTLLALAYYITKIEKYGSTIQISDDDEQGVMTEATDFLTQHKFYSISVRAQLSKQMHSDTERKSLLSSFELENLDRVNDILKHFLALSQYDIASTNKQLAAFVRNLEWDSGFIMRLLSIPFFDMANMSFTIKKQMLQDIVSVVKKYKEIPAEQKRIENYE